MKRVVFIAALLLAAAGLKAQDCETLMLPYFNGDYNRYSNYPAEKLEWRCNFARSAFYVADEVPAGAVVLPIEKVKDKWSGEALPKDFKVDLTKLSYYAYDFERLQLEHKDLKTTICFSTPGSEHPYLVLRSQHDMFELASKQTDNK